MSELNRENIIKALEACIEAEYCATCPAIDYCKGMDSLVENALALIKELTEEKKTLEYTLEGVMHSVDKWLDGEELEQDEVNRAITMREKTLKIVEDAESLAERLGNDVDLKLKYIYELEKRLSEIKADTVREIETRFAMRYGTYTDKDMTPITEVFRLLDQIAEEILEGRAMATCKDCLHFEACVAFLYSEIDCCATIEECKEEHANDEVCDLFKHTDDVVPRAEVEKIFEEIETLIRLNSLQGDVFIGKYFDADLENDIAELKKKYIGDKE